MPGWKRVMRRIIRRVWFRAALFSFLAVVLALLAAGLAPYVPYQISASIGSKAVDNILEILASSMLTVTTFSITAMVSAYAGAASTITPRATRLLIEDATAQNALSTFIGAFLFSIVGICALATDAYGEKGRVILFIGTLGVIAFIVFTLLRWIEHLSHFGRMLETIQRVERAAVRAAVTLAHRPHMGALSHEPPPLHARSVEANEIGYVTHIDVALLARVAASHAFRVHVAALPGTFVAPGRPVVRVEGDPTPQAQRALIAGFTIENGRAFEQDPRFGLVVLSEIASRALSPAVNDPGSAIAVVGAGLRVFASLLTTRPHVEAPTYSGVQVPEMALHDMLEDFFRPIARDGAGLLEVGLQVQKALGALQHLAPDAAAELRKRADDAMRRGEAALESEADRETLRLAYHAHWH